MQQKSDFYQTVIFAWNFTHLIYDWFLLIVACSLFYLPISCIQRTICLLLPLKSLDSKSVISTVKCKQ